MPRTTLKTRPLPGRVARATRAVKTPAARSKPQYCANNRNVPKNRKPEESPSSRIKGDLSNYFADISRGEPRLTPKEEMSLGKTLYEAIVATALKLSAQLESDLDLLAKTATYEVSLESATDPVLKARQRTRRLNPDRLRGKKLKAHIQEAFYSEAGLDLLKTYDPKIGGRTIERMIKANLLLVVSMARKYYRHGGSMPLSELIQEGNIGLILGTLRFDYKRGYRFSTYASWWIRHAITRAIADKAREIRIPVHMHEFSQTAAKYRAQLIEKLGRTPTIEEVADTLLAEKRKKLKSAPSSDVAAKERQQTIDKLHKMIVQTQLPVSLQTLIHTDNNDTELGELIPTEAPEELRPWAGLEDGLLQQAMNDHLTEFEQKVLRQRFGINTVDNQEVTFREIGDEHDLSRERIRQIQNNALRKLHKALERHVIT